MPLPTTEQLIAQYKKSGPLTTEQILGSAPAAPEKTTVATPVISAAPAQNLITNQIKPTFEAAQTAISNQQIQKQVDEAKAMVAQTEKEGLKPFSTTTQKTDATVTAPKSATDQAAEEIANTPEPGYRWAYQADGTRIPISLSEPTPKGFYDQKPSGEAFVIPGGSSPSETIPNDDGTFIGNMGDGTFAKFDSNGIFLGPANQNQYNIARNSKSYAIQEATKMAVDRQKQMDQVINGSYPLTPDQQAQIDSVKQTFQRLIDEQTKANMNYQGGVSTVQGLLGMTEYAPTLAMGTLKGAIDSGISKIADLNNKMLSTVSQMAIAFRQENFDMLEKAYNNYTAYAKTKQDQLDKITEAAASYEKDMRDYNLKVEQFLSDKEEKELDRELKREDLTLQEKKALMDDKYKWANLSEETRHNKVMEYQAEQKRIQDASMIYGQGADMPFAATTEIASRLGSTDKDRQGIKNSLNNAASRGDWKTYMTLLTNQANKSIGTAQQGNILDASKSISHLNALDKALKEYKALDGDMGYVKGTTDQIATNFGQLVTDPKFKEIAVQLQTLFQTYRQNMTGAAFGIAENKDYKSVYPQATDNFDLNFAKIEGAKKFLERNVDSVYSQVLNEGYSNVKNLAKLQDVYQDISQMDDALAGRQAALMVKTNPQMATDINLWIMQPWEDGTKKDGRDILYYVTQKLGNY